MLLVLLASRLSLDVVCYQKTGIQELNRDIHVTLSAMIGDKTAMGHITNGVREAVHSEGELC